MLKAGHLFSAFLGLFYDFQIRGDAIHTTHPRPLRGLSHWQDFTQTDCLPLLTHLRAHECFSVSLMSDIETNLSSFFFKKTAALCDSMLVKELNLDADC